MEDFPNLFLICGTLWALIVVMLLVYLLYRDRKMSERYHALDALVQKVYVELKKEDTDLSHRIVGVIQAVALEAKALELLKGNVLNLNRIIEDDSK
jgi:hypothetical protein